MKNGNDKKFKDNMIGIPKMKDGYKFLVVTTIKSGEETTAWFTVRELMDIVDNIIYKLPEWEVEYLREKING